MLNETEHAVQHEQLHKGNAGIGQHAAEENQRQRELLFVRIEARGDEGPDLVHQPRQRHQHTGHAEHLERHDERREDADRNQLRTLGHVVLDGHRDEVDQAIGAGPEREQCNAHRNAVDAVEQPVAQLHQVLHEGLLGAGQFVFFWRWEVCHGQTKTGALEARTLKTGHVATRMLCAGHGGNENCRTLWLLNAVSWVETLPRGPHPIVPWSARWSATCTTAAQRRV